jgi:hypothetical protein
MEAERNAAIAVGVVGLAAGAAGLRHAAKSNKYAQERYQATMAYERGWKKASDERAEFEEQRNVLLEYVNPLPNKMRAHAQFADDTFDGEASKKFKEIVRAARKVYDESPITDKAVPNDDFKDNVLGEWDRQFPKRSDGRQRIVEHFTSTHTMARRGLDRYYGTSRPIKITAGTE